VDSCGNPSADLAVHLEEDANDVLMNLPPAELLEDVVDTYFDVIQPWIPMLHETQFRQQVADRNQRPRLAIVLHAMVVAAIRFIGYPRSKLSAREIDAYTARSRRFVVLTSMDNLSVEGLQALIIIAFDDVGHTSCVLPHLCLADINIINYRLATERRLERGPSSDP
jgi:hypothetical protein